MKIKLSAIIMESRLLVAQKERAEGKGIRGKKENRCRVVVIVVVVEEERKKKRDSRTHALASKSEKLVACLPEELGRDREGKGEVSRDEEDDDDEREKERERESRTDGNRKRDRGRGLKCRRQRRSAFV